MNNRPTEPGYYWAKYNGAWTVAEVLDYQGRLIVTVIGNLAMGREQEEEYVNNPLWVEAWGARIVREAEG